MSLQGNAVQHRPRVCEIIFLQFACMYATCSYLGCPGPAKLLGATDVSQSLWHYMEIVRWQLPKCFPIWGLDAVWLILTQKPQGIMLAHLFIFCADQIQSSDLLLILQHKTEASSKGCLLLKPWVAVCCAIKAQIAGFLCKPTAHRAYFRGREGPKLSVLYSLHRNLRCVFLFLLPYQAIQ